MVNLITNLYQGRPMIQMLNNLSEIEEDLIEE